MLEDKIWRVQYSSEYTFFTTPEGKQGAAVLGMDFQSVEFEEKMKKSAANYGNEAVNLGMQSKHYKNVDFL